MNDIRSNPNSLYKIRKEQSEQGLLDWKQITKRDLYFLNLVERVTDAEIGELYGVAMNTVRNRKKKNKIDSNWNLDADETCQEIERYIWDILRNSKRTHIDFEKLYDILDIIHPDYNEVAK